MKDSKLEKFLFSGKYSEAREYVNDMRWEDVESSILSYGFDDGNFSSYSFTKYMYDETKAKRWSNLLESIDEASLCWVEGIHSIHLAHLRELIKNERTVENLELLFYFDVCPDAEGLIEKSEKINAARELLSLVPGHEDAMAYLNECEHDGFDDTKEKEEIAKDISDLEDLLDKAHYETAEEVIKGMDLQEVRDILVNLTAEILSVEACGFAHYMIKKTNAEEWFRIQFDILTVGLKRFRKYRVNSVALYYVRELVNISRTAGNLKLFLKLYHEPDHVVGREEAKQVAREILSMEPDNQVAKEVMQSTTFYET